MAGAQARVDMGSRPNSRHAGGGRTSPPLSARADVRPASSRTGASALGDGSASARLGGTRAASPGPRWMQADDDHSEGGVNHDISPGLAERLRQLVSKRDRQVSAWLIVECCRDCHNHDSSLRHDERAYMGRFEQLKEVVENRYPEGLAVELLVPRSTESATALPESSSSVLTARRNCRDVHPSYRIGSFEVYLCCASPLKPHGGSPLQVLPGRGAPPGRGSPFNVLCVASKLRSRMWPSIDSIVQRMAAAMPRVPIQIAVRTELDFPLPNVHVEACAPDDTKISHGETDHEGNVWLGLPMFSSLKMKAWHQELMELQEKEVEVVSANKCIPLTAETVVQLWQMETSKELVVYCSSPRVSRTGNMEGLVPFQGQLECDSGDALRADAAGYVRSRPDPLQDADLVSCPGWRSCPLGDAVKHVHGTGRVVELVRLGLPIAQVSLVTRCCSSAVPGAHIYVDNESFGITDDSGLPLSCGVRNGEHRLHAQHVLLGHQGLDVPLSISGSTTCGVQVELPLDRLRFVCVAAAGTRSSGGALADLWLVGGDLARWRGGRGAPAIDAEVWLWDGELQPPSRGGTSPPPLRVQAGVLCNNSNPSEDDNFGDQQGEDLDEDAVNASSGRRRHSSGGTCTFSDALASPASGIGPWQVVLHAAMLSGSVDCAVTRLGRLANGATPALWLARLVAEDPNSPSARSAEAPTLAVCCTCCNEGVGGVRLTVDGIDRGTTAEAGELQLAHAGASGKSHIGLHGIPSCLLPGGASEFVVQLGATKHERFELDVNPLIWVYWVPPEEPEPPEDEAEEVLPQEGTLWVCCNGDQVPDEALPVVGVLRCPGAEEKELRLDGSSMGPMLLRRQAGDVGGACLVSQITLEIQPPKGHLYREKKPSPLAERFEELGGCELQRLMHCPVVVGFLPLEAPSAARNPQVHAANRVALVEDSEMDNAEDLSFSGDGAELGNY
eukprot:TRINITY_DN64292_c0_g1_i1.p1 TRINITY_DN64292_c0_g1~~TRINITY_DN64292_c0_g1_i1.p1  ORF type:complete len:1002 (+),score=182.93 TRINITY_DN64292_c0_g1_i1:140-3007(+)